LPKLKTAYADSGLKASAFINPLLLSFLLALKKESNQRKKSF